MMYTIVDWDVDTYLLPFWQQSDLKIIFIVHLKLLYYYILRNLVRCND